MKKIVKEYPDAYAIYDIGSNYGVCVQELFFILNKDDLSEVDVLPRYDSKVLELIENAIPLWFAEDAD